MIELFKNMSLVTHQFDVTQKYTRQFQICSGDMNPLPYQIWNLQRVRDFRECVMYGNIINAFVSTLIGMCLPSPDVIIHSQDIQYKKPVFMNDVLDAEIRVEEVFESVNTVELKFTFRNQYSQVVSKGHVQIGVI